MNNPVEYIFNSNVSIYHNPELGYPEEAPYGPRNKHPEYFFLNLSQKENNVYDAVRNALFLLNMDKDNFGTTQWNPFKEMVKPGDTVVIKPNLVLDSHEEGGDIFSVITHPSVIRAIVDYVYIALKGKGRIIIADAPQMDCNFRELLEKTKLKSIEELYKKELGFNIEIYDLRDFWLDKKNRAEVAYQMNRYKLPGDPLGGVVINLGKESLFYGVNSYKKFYGADYNRDETIRHHHGDVQEYLVSKTILSSDVIIWIPKLKCHKKVGVTLNIKGLVGTVLNKNYLVHYTLGSSSEGGDQFPDGVFGTKEISKVKLQRWAYDKFLAKKNSTGDFLYNLACKFGRFFLKPLGFKSSKHEFVIDEGNWQGNDSAWRMAIDLLKIFLYSDKEGKLHDAPMRRMFSIVDGVIGGEKNGPLAPDTKRCGLIVAGFNPCAVDLVCARLMGFDHSKIRMLNYALRHPELFKTDLSEIKTFSNRNFNGLFDEDNKNKYFDFVPPLGWERAMEMK